MHEPNRYLLVALGGAAGSCARYAVGAFAARHLPLAFPWGTFLVNVTGSFVMALVVALTMDRFAEDPRWRLLLAVGFCGGFTTFSALAWETDRLLEARELWLAAANVVGSAVAGLVAIRLGIAAARWTAAAG
jgi:CrcB protein